MRDIIVLSISYLEKFIFGGEYREKNARIGIR